MKSETKRKLSDYKQSLASLTRDIDNVSGSVKKTKGFQEKQWKDDMKKLGANIKSLRDKL